MTPHLMADRWIVRLGKDDGAFEAVCLPPDQQDADLRAFPGSQDAVREAWATEEWGAAMKAKAKGARAERRARAMLEAQGYMVVRAGGSLGPFDLVAVSRSGVRLIQVKTNRRPCRAEREGLEELGKRMPPGATCELWLFRDRVREPEVEALS